MVKEVRLMNMLSYFHFGDNEACPCGSEKKFKECCKGKVDQQYAQSKKPVEVQVMEQMRKSMIKCCMHPDQDNCNGNIKNAHALQNNKIISLLAGNERHVYTMDKRRQPLVTLLDLEGAKAAELHLFALDQCGGHGIECSIQNALTVLLGQAGALGDSSDQISFIHNISSFLFQFVRF